MMQAIATRELFELSAPDGLIRGTYHKTHRGHSGDGTEPAEQDRVGVIFLNGLPATRAAHGNASVYWADSFAERGYACFRIDLPGFGDSDGNPPEEWLSYINLGGYAPIAAAKIRELTVQFNLSGAIVVGHCAGAVTAVYAAALNRECKGLVLIDPYFYAAQTERRKSRQQLSAWAERSRVGGVLSGIFGLLKKMYLSLRRNAYPDNANVPLLRRWKEVTSEGLPVLILKMPDRRTPGAKARAGQFDYFEYVLRLAGRKGRVDARAVEGANHTFSNHSGRAAVRRYTEQWLETYFPVEECRNSEASAKWNESHAGDMAVEVARSV